MLIDDADLAIKPMEWHYKRWLDRYPMQVEYKGGMMMINPEIVVITSQYTPEQIWEGDSTTLSAIRRRCSLISFDLDPTAMGPVSSVLPYGAVGSGSVGSNESFCVEQPYENGYRCHITYEKN